MITIEDLAELMNEAAEGSREAFERIVTLMSPNLGKVIRFYLNRDPEDVLQELWLDIWKKSYALAGKDKPESWFYSAARYHCISTLRKELSQKRFYEGDSYRVFDYESLQIAASDFVGAEELTIQNESYEFLHRFLEELPDIYSMPLYLYYFEDMPLKEIAALLDISVSTVKWRLHTGRQLLKKAYFSFYERGY